jgi:hypothetical protein
LIYPENCCGRQKPEEFYFLRDPVNPLFLLSIPYFDTGKIPLTLVLNNCGCH